VFAGGDCITGPDIAIRAIGAGRRAALAIDEYFRSGRVTPEPDIYSCSKGHWDQVPQDEFRNVAPGKRNAIPLVDAEQRKANFVEVSETWDVNTAVREASRCLACGCTERYDCIVRRYASMYGVEFDKNGGAVRRLPVDDKHPILVRDPGKCVLCGLCLKVCREMEGSAALTFHEVNDVLTIGPVDQRPLDKTTCVSCGHCVTVCPTGALTFKPVLPAVYRALNDNNLTVVAQIAPAVRAAFAQHYGVSGAEAMGLLAAGLKQAGFNAVFDTCWAADLTVMEEGTEFLTRLSQGGTLPQFTSCCPAWINYCEKVAPDLLPHLSSCKSPQQMFGSVVKEYYAGQRKLPAESLYFVSVMPCNAKKYESKRAEFSNGVMPDVDAVLTTNEIIDMFADKRIDPHVLAPVELDTPFGNTSGAGIIFGASGGVAEAALRLAAERISGHRVPNVEYRDVRGLQGIKEATVTVNDVTVRLAVVSGLQNAQALIDRIRAGDAPYDLIEVMACPGGCINGSGNPQPQLTTDRQERLEVLYRLDESATIKTSQDNPAVQAVYSNWLGEPTGEESHHALHTSYGRRSMRVEESLEQLLEEQPVVDIAVCVSTNCFLKGSWKILEEMAAELRQRGLTDRFRVRARFCANNCANGPSVTVGQHKVMHVDADNVKGFIEEYMLPALDAARSDEVAS
jgi:formate dehydrogenase major subunit